jgi:hypothetical protein
MSTFNFALAQARLRALRDEGLLFRESAALLHSSNEHLAFLLLDAAHRDCAASDFYVSLLFYLHPFDFVHIYILVFNPVINRVNFVLVSAKLLLVNVTAADFPNECKSGHARSLLLMNLSRMLHT